MADAPPAVEDLDALIAARKRHAPRCSRVPGECVPERCETLAQFAVRAGVDPKTIYRLRRDGALARPTTGVLTLIALAARVPVARVRAALAATVGPR